MSNLKQTIIRIIVISALAIIFLFSTWSLYTNHFFKVHDFTTGTRIAEMAISLKEGHFPVRWSRNFGYGFGMPLFNFYAPLPYYLAGLIFNLGLPLILTIKLIFYFLPTFLTLLGAYQLGKSLFGRLSGIVLAAAYTLAPYRAVDLFVRGALSEIWAMAFFPWVIYALIILANQWKIKKENKSNYLLLILSLVGIILSHNLSALMFIPLSAFFAFILFLKTNQFRLKKTIICILPVMYSYLLSFLLSAFYLLPSFMEKSLTKIDFIFSGYFEYYQHFLYIRQFFQNNWGYGGSVWGPEDGMSFFLGFGQILGISCLLILIIIFLIKNKKQVKTIFKIDKIFYSMIFGFFSLLTLFLAIMKSKFFWDNLSLLQYLQFPWRWLVVANLFIAILVALSSTFIKNRLWRYLYLLILIICILFNASFFKPEKYLLTAESIYYSDQNKIQNQMSEILPDYIPIQMAEYQVLKQSNKKYQQLWLNNIDQNITNFAFHVDHGHEKLVELTLSDEALVNFKVAYFPGWRAEIDGQQTNIIVNQDIGNIQVLVPKGTSKVGLFFSENTFPRTLGDLLTISGLVIFFLYFSPFVDSKSKKQKLKKN